MERFDIPRSKIKPDTPLGSLISINERKQYWQTILLELSEGQTILAPLKRPKQLNLFVLGTPILLIIPLSLYIGFSISVGVAILVMILLVFATNPMRSEFPRQFSTVGDLVKITKTLQPQKWKDKNEVYLRIRKLTAEQLGLNEEEIFPDSHFVKDLGID